MVGADGYIVDVDVAAAVVDDVVVAAVVAAAVAVVAAVAAVAECGSDFVLKSPFEMDSVTGAMHSRYVENYAQAFQDLKKMVRVKVYTGKNKKAVIIESNLTEK